MINMTQITGGLKTAGVATLGVAKKVATHKATKIAAVVLLCATVVGGIALATLKLVKHVQAKRAYAAEENTIVGKVKHRAQEAQAYVTKKAAAAQKQAGIAVETTKTFAKDHKNALLLGSFGAFVLGGLSYADAFGINDTVANAATSGFSTASDYATNGFNAVSGYAANGFNAVSSRIYG